MGSNLWLTVPAADVLPGCALWTQVCPLEATRTVASGVRRASMPCTPTRRSRLCTSQSRTPLHGTEACECDQVVLAVYSHAACPLAILSCHGQACVCWSIWREIGQAADCSFGLWVSAHCQVEPDQCEVQRSAVYTVHCMHVHRPRCSSAYLQHSLTQTDSGSEPVLRIG